MVHFLLQQPGSPDVITRDDLATALKVGFLLKFTLFLVGTLNISDQLRRQSSLASCLFCLLLCCSLFWW